jgi:hypothetical protein
VVFGLALLAVLPTLVGVTMFEVLGVLLKPLAVGGMCAGLGLFAARGLAASSGELARGVVAVLVFGLIAAVSNWIWFRAEWRGAVGTLFAGRMVAAKSAA